MCIADWLSMEFGVTVDYEHLACDRREKPFKMLLDHRRDRNINFICPTLL
jgi:hypothetical protein